MGLLLTVCMAVEAQKWTTLFAYNNVEQIALGNECVYALSDGSLFSVDKQTEQIKVYNNRSGLHGTGITAIHYDQATQSLLIGYESGKIDVLTKQGVQYVGDLYDKDMTQRKTIYNFTIRNYIAYLSTHYGVQTFDLREHKLVDSYWLRPGGQETPVMDVKIAGDTIYAFGQDSLYSAALSSNLVDYTVWKREQKGRVAPDEEKGKHYVDGNDHWYAGHAEGVVRFTPTSRLTYKPDGPIVNMPYAMSTRGEMLYVVAGGRWTSQNETPGYVMRYDGHSWLNILPDPIQQKTGTKALDFMNVAIDPQDPQHYYIPSYGTGLYEFRGDSCVYHTLANDVIGSAVASNPQLYTRLAGAHYDADNRLWFCDAGEVTYPIVVKEGAQYYGLPIVINGQPIIYSIPCDLVLDNRDAHYVWVASAYKSSWLVLLNHQGTLSDVSDDVAYQRNEWTNQHGKSFKPVDIFAVMQDRKGRLWMATEMGVAYIDAETDFFTSDAIIQPDVMDTNGENPLTTLRFKALCQTPDGHIWAGSESLGVYELNEDATEILGYYTTDNSAMSANGILSLVASEDGCVYIGTSEGLVKYNPNGLDEGLSNAGSDDEALDEGVMLRWKLHLSYSNAEEVAATPSHVYAAANGSLFSIDRADERLECLNKSTGLSGTTVAHIVYDKRSERLVVAYENGQIDLLDEDGTVTQMPDLSMKAGSITVTVNGMFAGSKYVYLAMPFGIVAIEPRKGEVTDTYYIGDDAAAVEVQQVVEMGDSLYAFSYDRLYRAALSDNLVDYSYWRSEAMPFETVDQAVVYNDRIYVLAHDTLYRRAANGWQQVVNEPLKWVHVSGGQMLTYVRNKGLYKMGDEAQLVGLTDRYVAQDAVYSNGEYWLAEEGQGLVRLGTEGDAMFRAEGPMSNYGYRLQVAHDRLYVAPGGRWASQMGRQTGMSILEGNQWRGIPWQDTWYYTDHDIRDVVGYAVDAADPGHFYVATYGTGVFEFKDYKAVQHYDSVNSSLRRVNSGVNDYYFTRTDGAMLDEQGNLWVLNATDIGNPLHVKTPMGQWYGLKLNSNEGEIYFSTPYGIWVDQRNSQWKWMMDQREKPRLILLDDGGTPTMSGDDRCVARSSFVDQNSKTVKPNYFHCLAQDHQNRIWVGTEKGIILIPSSVNFFNSGSCQRIIIPRNDGTDLGDYLLGDEQINCMAVDGGDRMWIGTANSGLYLIEDDTITVAHFTETNSLLPSNNIQSIAIMPTTGEVFVGTDRGIASYRSDASAPQETMQQAYAFPNPVRPDYGGVISITGLMENTVVNIVDEGGNLICKTRSNGGMAVWDGKAQNGSRAKGGVYTALCNAPDGSHTVVKILVIR